MFFKTVITVAGLAILANCGAPERSELEPELVESPKDAVEASQSKAELINRGQGIAEAACASCHAIGLNDTSQHAEAPAFRTIGQKYSVWTLDEALAEGIMVGHPDMPVWELIPDDIEGLLTYMESIQVE